MIWASCSTRAAVVITRSSASRRRSSIRFAPANPANVAFGLLISSEKFTSSCCVVMTFTLVSKFWGVEGALPGVRRDAYGEPRSPRADASGLRGAGAQTGRSQPGPSGVPSQTRCDSRVTVMPNPD